MIFYQFVDVFWDGDGIGNDIKGIHSLIIQNGYNSKIVTRINYSKLNEVLLLDELKTNNDDILILHYGGAGFPLDFYFNLPGKKILRFHNFTPIKIFKNFIDIELWNSLEKNYLKSILELNSIYKKVDFILHDSRFNELSFKSFVNIENISKMEVLPIFRKYNIAKKTEKISKKICFVGRWAPNKRIEHLLFILFYLKKISKDYKLILIGKKNLVFKKYENYIYSIITELELNDSIEIYSELEDSEVEKKILESSIYLSMSEHEGFGIPILEAISKNSLVICFLTKALKEILQSSGIYILKKKFSIISELINYILEDENLYFSLLDSQLERLKVYNEFPFEKKFFEIITNL